MEPEIPEVEQDWREQCRLRPSICYEGLNDPECERRKGHAGWHYADCTGQHVWWERSVIER